jgi:hypothetical protein
MKAQEHSLKSKIFFENQMIVVDIKDFDGDGYVDFLISKKDLIHLDTPQSTKMNLCRQGA